MAGIYNIIDSGMKKEFNGKRTELIAEGMPLGHIEFIDTDKIESLPIKSTQGCSTMFIRGKLDAVLALDDGTYGIVDFKTSKALPEKVNIYSAQLHSYKVALEHPDAKGLRRFPITKMGLLVYEPAGFTNAQIGEGALRGKLTWLEIPIDEPGFYGFLEEVYHLLHSRRAPPKSKKCDFCNSH